MEAPDFLTKSTTFAREFHALSLSKNFASVASDGGRVINEVAIMAINVQRKIATTGMIENSISPGKLMSIE